MNLFGISTHEILPAIYFQSHKAWDAYMAHIWYNIFYFLNLNPEDTIVEVGPGTSIKIALALAKCNYKGRIYLIDPYEAALREVEKLYNYYLPNAEIHILNKTLAECIEFLPKIKFLISNHSLDDMILAAGLTKNELIDLFHWVSVDAESLFPISQKIWHELESNTHKLSIVKKKIVAEWQDALHKLDPDRCILSQYDSSTLNNYGMEGLNKNAKDIFFALKKVCAMYLLPEKTTQTLLNANKNFNDKHIGTEVLNAHNWLIYKK